MAGTHEKPQKGGEQQGDVIEASFSVIPNLPGSDSTTGNSSLVPIQSSREAIPVRDPEAANWNEPYQLAQRIFLPLIGNDKDQNITPLQEDIVNAAVLMVNQSCELGVYNNPWYYNRLFLFQNAGLRAALRTMGVLQNQSFSDEIYNKTQQDYQETLRIKMQNPLLDEGRATVYALANRPDIRSRSDVDEQFKSIQRGVMTGLVPQIDILTERVQKSTDQQTVKNSKDALRTSIGLMFSYGMEPHLATEGPDGFEQYIKDGAGAAGAAIETSLGYDPVFSMELLREMFIHVSKKDQGEAVRYFRRSYPDVADKVLGTVAKTDLPDQSKEAQELLAGSYGDALDIMSTPYITADLDDKAVIKGNRMLRAVPGFRYEQNPLGAAGFIDMYREHVDPAVASVAGNK